MPVFRRSLFGIVIALLLFAFGAFDVSAQTWGEFYVHDDARYWWFRDNGNLFEVGVPANPAYAVQRTTFGERLLALSLDEGKVHMEIAGFSGGQAQLDKARAAITSRWEHVLTDVKLTENRTIRTSKGLEARFVVVQGRTDSGRTGMVRAVLFTTGTNGAYLVWTGETNAYTGAMQQAWIEAVNSFTWLK